MSIQNSIPRFLIMSIIMMLPIPVFAEKLPIQLQLISTSVGSGIHGGYHFNDKFFSGADYSSFSMDFEDSDPGGTVSGSLNFMTLVLAARYAPFEGAFHIQGGLVSRRWELEATGTAFVGDSLELGAITATVEFSPIALNYGLGWNWIADFGLSGGLGLGVISGPPPTVDLEATGLFTLIPDEEIKKEEEDFEKELAGLATFPYFQFNIGWNF